jgi:hypothetical protein
VRWRRLARLGGGGDGSWPVAVAPSLGWAPTAADVTELGRRCPLVRSTPDPVTPWPDPGAARRGALLCGGGVV